MLLEEMAGVVEAHVDGQVNIRRRYSLFDLATFFSANVQAVASGHVFVMSREDLGLGLIVCSSLAFGCKPSLTPTPGTLGCWVTETICTLVKDCKVPYFDVTVW